jgi:peptide/nickel transport system substrate-binding protein
VALKVSKRQIHSKKTKKTRRNEEVKKHTELLLELVMILALAGSLVTSCAPPAETPTAAPPAEATAAPAEPTAAPTPVPPSGGPKRGGTLTWTRFKIVEMMDPANSDANYNNWVFVNVYETLVAPNREGTDLEPRLAESWDISEDGLVYTFHLRPGVKFHDGSPLKASDVVWTLNRLNDPEKFWGWTMENVEGIREVDDSTVEITLKDPSAAFLSMLANFSAPVLPQECVEEMGEEEFFNHPIGTGPFKVAEWVKSDYILFEKNPHYWRMGADGEPLPYLDAVKMIQVPDESTRVLQVQAGDADATDEVPYSMIDELAANPNVLMELYPATQSYYVWLNHRVPPLDDVKVRLAMNYAFDKQALVDAVTFGKATVATSLRPPHTMCWKELEGFPYDLEKAKQLMAESSYPDGFKGLKLEVTAGSIVGRDVSVMAKEMWAEIGIEVELSEVESSTLIERYQNADFEMVCGSYFQWTDDVIDPSPQIGYCAVDPAMQSGWHNDRVIELAGAARVEMDPDKRCELYQEIEQIFNEEAVTILAWNNPYSVLLSPDVKDFTQSPLGSLLFGDAWLDR